MLPFLCTIAICALSLGMPDLILLGVSWQLGHFGQAIRTNITVFIFAYAFHRSAKNTFRTVTLKNDVIALHQNFYRITFIHLVSFTQGLRQNNSTQLIYFSNYASRFHI
ncbi:hypothetical protein PGRAT_10030 [Paenibacillus graminis]|uniref:Uncharacterized protein n=1 Tax=Paenibacillus graminis TaxID=189425 RepID=A0A089M6F8_9BACL|nr:hypothetical protein PGRAT_10030 [Paenibacillus graminis]